MPILTGKANRPQQVIADRQRGRQAHKQAVLVGRLKSRVKCNANLIAEALSNPYVKQGSAQSMFAARHVGRQPFHYLSRKNGCLWVVYLTANVIRKLTAAGVDGQPQSYREHSS